MVIIKYCEGKNEDPQNVLRICPSLAKLSLAKLLIGFVTRKPVFFSCPTRDNNVLACWLSRNERSRSSCFCKVVLFLEVLEAPRHSFWAKIGCFLVPFRFSKKGIRWWSCCPCPRSLCACRHHAMETVDIMETKENPWNQAETTETSRKPRKTQETKQKQQKQAENSRNQAETTETSRLNFGLNLVWILVWSWSEFWSEFGLNFGLNLVWILVWIWSEFWSEFLGLGSLKPRAASDLDQYWCSLLKILGNWLRPRKSSMFSPQNILKIFRG